MEKCSLVLILQHGVFSRHFSLMYQGSLNVNISIYFAEDEWTVDGDNDIDGMAFTTLDRDNDHADENCASDHMGCWWYNSCSSGQLSGEWGLQETGTSEEYHGLLWGSEYNIQYAVLMIKVV